MKKLLLSLSAVLMSSACCFMDIIKQEDTSYWENIEACPKVHIRSGDRDIIQYENKDPLFEVSIIGYEGFCYFNEKVHQDRAVLKPKFRIKRLIDNDVTAIDFSYYMETFHGPDNILGKKNYFADVLMPEGVDEVEMVVEAGEIEMSPQRDEDFDIYMGLNADVADWQYKIK